MVVAMGIAATAGPAATAIAVGINVGMMTVMAAGVMAYGQIQQGKAEKRRWEYQAAVSRNNQKVAEWNAQDAIDRGEIAEKQHRLKVSQIQGKQRSALAASGVEVDSGSSLDVLQDTEYFGEMDALTIRNNAQREAYKYKVNAQNQMAQSGLYSMQGRDALSASKMNATSTLVSGAAKGYGQYSTLAAG
jgi:hypothetical protein